MLVYGNMFILCFQINPCFHWIVCLIQSLKRAAVAPPAFHDESGFIDLSGSRVYINVSLLEDSTRAETVSLIL